MSKKFFGTDGIRGVANIKLTPELAFHVGLSAGRWLAGTDLPKRVVVGRDTRISGSMLGAALASGFCSAGINVRTLGVAPTGAISYIARCGDFGLGSVISASHNPAPDNGIKLISHDGTKISEAVEQAIEAALFGEFEGRPTGGAVGQISPAEDEIEGYMRYLEGIVPEGLAGMKIAVDGANGAAFQLGYQIFERLGATVVVTGDRPNGVNINADGGATKPHVIQHLTKDSGCDIGVAYDGDADRAVFSDNLGRLINGDRTMAIWCAYWSEKLQPKVVVGTVMSNGGFAAHMHDSGIELTRVNVGDKYVSAKLNEIGGKVGGEQSGHIIFPERGPTGDGLITALELIRAIKLSGRPASEHFDAYDSWPQLLVNIEINDREALGKSDKVLGAIKTAEALVGDRGRVNVRPSGTQPMVRVMVEADAVELRDEAMECIVRAMFDDLEGREYSRVDLTHALGD